MKVSKGNLESIDREQMLRTPIMKGRHDLIAMRKAARNSVQKKGKKKKKKKDRAANDQIS